MRFPIPQRMAAIAAVVYLLDQLSKGVVIQRLNYADQWVVVEGFFKFVHWGNTGAAWSLFHGNNGLLALVSLVAMVILAYTMPRFDIRSPAGWWAFGLIYGGILGNLTDRLRVGHVIDFIRFYLYQRGGGEVGFPAFNVADTTICVGVGLLFLLSWRNEGRVPQARRGVSAA